MGDIIINVEHAVKKFRDTTALDDVSMAFERNRIHGLIGRNGSGKTVLLKSICGLTRLTSGLIEVNGKKIGKDVQIPDRIGIIIEAPGFYQNFSGYDNLKYLAAIRGKAGKKEIREAMTRVGLDPGMKKWVGKYSLGMRQRLGIAQAIMENPDILILDEPTNGLDNHGVDEFRELMKSFLAEGKTILLASHNAEDIGLLCDTVHELDGGKLRG
jgi:ABC-2 type transport system ATP-binding protein